RIEGHGLAWACAAAQARTCDLEHGGLVAMDTRRHAPVGRRRVRLPSPHVRTRSPGYLGRGSRPQGDLFISDHADSRQAGRFRWLISTCLAGAVGVLAIIVVIAGSTDSHETGGFLPSLRRARDASIPSLHLPSARVDGLSWAIPKTDRLLIPSGAMATTFLV